MILFSLESWSMHFSSAKHKQSFFFSSVSPAPEHFLVSTFLYSLFFFLSLIWQRDNEANPIGPRFHFRNLEKSRLVISSSSSSSSGSPPGVCFANNLKFVLFIFFYLFIYLFILFIYFILFFFPPFFVFLFFYPSLSYSRAYISILSAFRLLCRFVYIFFFSFSF